MEIRERRTFAPQMIKVRTFYPGIAPESCVSVALIICQYVNYVWFAVHFLNNLNGNSNFLWCQVLKFVVAFA